MVPTRLPVPTALKLILEDKTSKKRRKQEVSEEDASQKEELDVYLKAYEDEDVDEPNGVYFDELCQYKELEVDDDNILEVKIKTTYGASIRDDTEARSEYQSSVTSQAVFSNFQKINVQAWKNRTLCYDRYNLRKLTYALVSYHVTENKKHVGSATNWTNNALFAMEDIDPEATPDRFRDLIIEGKSIKYSHPSLLALTFPHLFTTSSGH
ncbi:hypothetical protein BD408DRAFT_468114 [Parasitella parasitica]|nr:hypothetical protein BD408DRAFT_468114 [Parasitella parasitica]